MAENRRIRPPSDLKARGRALWRRVVEEFDLGVDELQVLGEAARVADTCEALAALVERDGLTDVGSRGQARVHPVAVELRASRAQLAQLLSQLHLQDADGRGLESTATVRARRAARSRWDRRLKVVEPPTPARVSRYAHLQGPGDRPA